MTSKVLKEICLTVSGVAASVALFFAGAVALGQQSASPALLIGIASLAVVWIVLHAITLYLVENWGIILLLCLTATGATIVAGGLTWGAIGGGLLLALFSGVAAQAFKRDARHLRHYRTINIFGAGTRLLLTGLILAGAGIALPVIEGSIQREGLAVTPEQVTWILRPLAPVLQDILPSFSATTDINSLIDEQLRKQGIDPATVSPAERALLHQQVSQQLNIPVTGQEPMADIITGRLNQSLQRLTQSNALTVALVAVVVIFFTLRAFIPALAWVLLGFIAAAMWIARRTGIVLAFVETIQTEKLTL